MRPPHIGVPEQQWSESQFGGDTLVVRASGLPDGALVEVGTDHRLADPEPLEALARAVDAR